MLFRQRCFYVKKAILLYTFPEKNAIIVVDPGLNEKIEIYLLYKLFYVAALTLFKWECYNKLRTHSNETVKRFI